MGKITHKDFQAAIHAARGEIQRISKMYKRQGWDIALGTSGTAKAVAGAIAAESSGSVITLSAMRDLADKIVQAGNVRKAKLTIKPERVEVFAGGLAVLMAVFEELGVAEMAFNEAALRDGVFYDLIERDYEDDLREQTALQFQERYHVSKNQAKRVWDTAQRFLRSLAQNATVQELDHWNQYLHWSAMLHEIGIDIAHTAYHKHTAYILAQADMPGFSRDEQELLAQITMGQRGDLRKMTQWDNMSEMQWNTIFALRLAVLFNRARLPLTLPENTQLRRHGAAIVLNISRDWLNRNPLTAAALQSEVEAWDKIARPLSLHILD